MNNKNLGTLAAVLACGGALAAVLLWPGEEQKQEVDQKVAVRAAEAETDGWNISLNNAVTVTAVEDDRKTRDFAFTEVKDAFKAEGVEITGAGSMVLTSQHTGGKLETQLLSADARKEGNARTIKRAKKPVASTETAADKGSVRYSGFFEGIDLEYRYDGKDIEEFFHLSDGLKQALVRSGEDLVITALMPGLFMENGALLKGGDGSQVDTRALKEGEHPPTPESTCKDIRMMGDVDLSNGEHRFGLPGAVAIDGNGKREPLWREFKWTPKGLEVLVEMPASWLAEAEGKVVIDPSVVDSGRGLATVTWNERNFVKDSTGNYHVGYRGVYHGRWLPVHSEGTTDGTTWQTPDLIQWELGPGENQYYAPSLIIDSRDTLHAIWADHGYIPNGPVDGTVNIKGTYGSWGHRVRYARCPNACAAAATANQTQSIWEPSDEEAQLRWMTPIVNNQIAPTAAQHQAYYHMAVDSYDMLHMTWAEWGVINARHRYFQMDAVAGTAIVEKQGLGWNDIHSQIVVDENDQVHYLGSDYWTTYGVKHFSWDRPSEEWEPRPNFSPRNPAGGNAGRMHGREMTAAVDANNHIHVALSMYDRWHEQRYQIWYGRYDPNDDQWEDAALLKPPDPHEYRPSITVDSDNIAWVAWRRNSQPVTVVLFANHQAGQNDWDSPPIRQLLFSTGAQADPQIRPRLSYPRDAPLNPNVAAGDNPNHHVLAGVLDVILVENGSELRYLSTGAPVEGPAPAVPLDHTFTNDTTPNFEWRAVGSDNRAGNVTYELQVAGTPLFTSPEALDPGTAIGYDYANSVNAPIADNQYRYWRVRAKNRFGAGPWGRIYEVGIDTSPPQPFNLTSPEDGTDPGTRTPRFEWNAATDD